MVHFTVPGAAAPQGSKRPFIVRNRAGEARGVNMVESSKAVKGWREDVKVFAHNAMHGRPAIKGAVAVAIIFDIPRPKSSPKRQYAVTRPDIDKLARAILDALTATVFVDDSQVVSLNVRKHLVDWDAAPCARIAVVDLEEKW